LMLIMGVVLIEGLGFVEWTQRVESKFKDG